MYLTCVEKVTYIAVIVSCLQLAGCQKQAEAPYMVEVVSSDSVYSLGIPSFLQPGYDMHPFASIQYYDTASQFFVLGMEDSKNNLGAIKRRRLKLRGYFNYMETIALERVDSFMYVASYRDTLAQGLSIQSQDYYATIDPFPDLPLFYRVAVYENDEYFYQLIIWMPYADHCPLMPWIDSITQSLHFLPPNDGFTIAK
ncbi:MAG: hypothetical protein NWR72_12110, partial [Bacteroidia bacterium]|nr:hypothetical protein [Bacteroidia bacterium]